MLHSPGLRDVVHFGDQWPTVPEEIIGELRLKFGDDRVHMLDPALAPGEAIQIAGGAFHGLDAVITRVLPARQRVTVLLEFLGRQTPVELPAATVIRETHERRGIL